MKKNILIITVFHFFTLLSLKAFAVQNNYCSEILSTIADSRPGSGNKLISIMGKFKDDLPQDLESLTQLSSEIEVLQSQIKKLAQNPQETIIKYDEAAVYKKIALYVAAFFGNEKANAYLTSIKVYANVDLNIKNTLGDIKYIKKLVDKEINIKQYNIRFRYDIEKAKAIHSEVNKYLKSDDKLVYNISSAIIASGRGKEFVQEAISIYDEVKKGLPKGYKRVETISSAIISTGKGKEFVEEAVMIYNEVNKYFPKKIDKVNAISSGIIQSRKGKEYIQEAIIIYNEVNLYERGSYQRVNIVSNAIISSGKGKEFVQEAIEIYKEAENYLDESYGQAYAIASAIVISGNGKEFIQEAVAIYNEAYKHFNYSARQVFVISSSIIRMGPL